jgi:hypothetical protein
LNFFILKAYEQKNIRRRVYDAINVLLAMNIIAKDKKDIRWVGFPVNALFECELIDVNFDIKYFLIRKYYWIFFFLNRKK